MIALDVGFAEGLSVVNRDPYLPIGLLLGGASSFAWFEMYRLVCADGYRSIEKLTYITEYARRRKQRGWPIWPVCFFLFCLILGVSRL